jgi:hypothetical protein
VVAVVTDDHKVYFCRSELNPADYIIWARTADNESSYMFLTRSDLKLIRAHIFALRHSDGLSPIVLHVGKLASLMPHEKNNLADVDFW